MARQIRSAQLRLFNLLLLNYLCLLDYVSGGELFTHLCSKGNFEMREARFYIAELVVALDHLHRVRPFHFN